MFTANVHNIEEAQGLHSTRWLIAQAGLHYNLVSCSNPASNAGSI